MLKHFLLLLLIGLTMTGWARNWNAKTDWRATGDGKTDDSPAIQRGAAAMRSGYTVVFTYNAFENMTYGPNNFRSNGGFFIGGGSNQMVIRPGLLHKPNNREVASIHLSSWVE
jgi:hypothetical protein